MQRLLGILSLSLSLPLPWLHTHAQLLSQNKQMNKQIKLQMWDYKPVLLFFMGVEEHLRKQRLSTETSKGCLPTYPPLPMCFRPSPFIPASAITKQHGGAWVAQLVRHPTSARVMIARSVSSSPTSSPVLTAQSLEPVSDSVSLSL